MLDRLQHSAAALRGLPFLRPVAVRIENATAVQEHARASLDADDLQRSRTIYCALGLLSPDQDLVSLLTAVMGEQILGYYDPDASVLVLRDTVVAGLGRSPRDPTGLESRLVLVHELVHALQDQHFDLSALLAATETSDAANALSAVVEGDAMLVSTAFTTLTTPREASPEALQGLTAEPQRLASWLGGAEARAAAGPELASAPAIVREPLISAYYDGLLYAAHAYRQGAEHRAIDQALRTPPTATARILHPEQPAIRPSPVVPSRGRWLRTHGYVAVAQDTLGELEIRIFFQAGTPWATARRAQEAAEGWTGDRVQIFRSAQGHTLALWVMRWATVRDAREAERAAAHSLTSLAAHDASTHHATLQRGHYLALLRSSEQVNDRQVLQAALDAQLDRPATAH